MWTLFFLFTVKTDYLARPTHTKIAYDLAMDLNFPGRWEKHWKTHTRITRSYLVVIRNYVQKPPINQPTNQPQATPPHPPQANNPQNPEKAKKPYNSIFMSREPIVPTFFLVIHSALIRLITQCLVYKKRLQNHQNKTNPHTTTLSKYKNICSSFTVPPKKCNFSIHLMTVEDLTNLTIGSQWHIY